MKYEVYSTEATADLSVINFISDGRKGNIPKRVVFEATQIENVYNLAFGDIDENGNVDDYRISDNGDRNKILATIVDLIKVYTLKYPNRMILFRGSTPERTRLYRMAVALNLEELSADFNIYVYADGEILPFSANKNITTFLVIRKKV